MGWHMKKIYTYFNINGRQITAGERISLFTDVFYTLIILLIISIPSNLLSQPLADGKSKFLGCEGGPTFRTNFSKYFNQVSPGNAGKWGSVENTQDNYNWTPLDNTYNYSQTKGFLYKHHTLVWGQQQPEWIKNLDSASQRAQVEEWIRLVGEKYPEMDFVDVVNEPFHAEPSYKNALGGNGKTGWDWVVTSFELARKYCNPNTKLILNEYSVLHDIATTDKYIRLIDTLKVRGLIDGIGIQGHYFEFKGTGYTYNVNIIKANLNKLTATGLPVYITEFDINEQDDEVQLQNYKLYFPIFWENPGVKGITLWGYYEGETWKTYAYIVTTRNAERPALTWLKTYIASPIRPILVSPVNVTKVSLKPTLVWNSSAEATSYNVQVSTSSSFTSLVVDSTVADTLLQIDTLNASTTYYWRVNASSDKGTSEYSSLASFKTEDAVSALNETKKVVNKYNLLQNYPNPFNPVTTIRFSLAKEGNVNLSVYDVLGNKVKELIEGRYAAGYHSVKLDASDLSTGVYFYRLQAGGFISVKKLILMK